MSSGGGGGGASGSSLGHVDAQEALKEQVATQAAQGVTYTCGDCAEDVTLRPRDAVRCPYCGYRILYKKRTQRLQQYEAR